MGSEIRVMVRATEIYICKDWQSLEEAELEYSSQIEDRKQAQIDAQELCGRNRRIRKIAYYSVAENGSFRRLLTYENPTFVPPHVETRLTPMAPQITAARMRSKRQEASLWSRIVGLFAAEQRTLRLGNRY